MLIPIEREDVIKLTTESGAELEVTQDGENMGFSVQVSASEDKVGKYNTKWISSLCTSKRRILSYYRY